MMTRIHIGRVAVSWLGQSAVEFAVAIRRSIPSSKQRQLAELDVCVYHRCLAMALSSRQSLHCVRYGVSLVSLCVFGQIMDSSEFCRYYYYFFK